MPSPSPLSPSPLFGLPSPPTVLSPSRLGAIASSLLSTSPNTNIQLGASTGTFRSRYTSTPSTLTLLHRIAGSGISVLCIYSEFCVFHPFQCILTLSVSCAGVSIPFPMLCASVHAFNPSAWSLKPFGSSTRHLVPPAPRYVPAPSLWLIL